MSRKLLLTTPLTAAQIEPASSDFASLKLLQPKDIGVSGEVLTWGKSMKS